MATAAVFTPLRLNLHYLVALRHLLQPAGSLVDVADDHVAEVAACRKRNEGTKVSVCLVDWLVVGEKTASCNSILAGHMRQYNGKDLKHRNYV